VTSSHGVFARLEHHKSHEYCSRRTAGAGGGGGGGSRKRRGRPPKSAADYEFSEAEIRARAAVDGPSSAIAHGFVRYTGADQCPDKRCAHRYREHFHCVRARCHDVELAPPALVAHDREFHAHVRIADGFEFFGADVDCRRAKCRARRGTSGPTGLRHFHCVRSGCDYAFVRQSTMAQHEAKHRMSDKQTLMSAMMMSSQTSTSSSSRQPVRIVPRQTATVSLLSSPSYSAVGMPTVLGEALPPGACPTSLFAGPSLPTKIMTTTFAGVPSLLITGLPTAPVTVAAGSVPVTSLPPQATVGVTVPGAVVKGLVSSAPPPSVVVVAADAKSNELSRSSQPLPLNGAQPTAVLPPPDDVPLLPVRNHHGVGVDCGRPTCQLKRCDHFHCVQCDIAITDVLRLREHLTRAHGFVAVGSAPAVQTPISRETSNSASTSTTSPPSAASITPVSQPHPVRSQLTSVNVENTGLQDTLNNNAQQHDNDNDNDNGGVLVVDLTSSGKARLSNSEGGNASSEVDDLKSTLNMKTVSGIAGQ